MLGMASGTICEPYDMLLPSAVSATIESTLLLQAMPDDLRSAVAACRSQRLNGALKAVKRVRLSIHHYLKGFVVIIAACFANRHGHAPLC